GGLWWRRDSKAKRDRMVVQEVGLARFQRPPANAKASAPFGGNTQPSIKEKHRGLPSCSVVGGGIRSQKRWVGGGRIVAGCRARRAGFWRLKPLIFTLHFLVISLRYDLSPQFSWLFLVANGKSWDCQVGIGGGNNRLRLVCLVVQEGWQK
nr:hypothetical protein [Tanacetum cinerariifolium]